MHKYISACNNREFPVLHTKQHARHLVGVAQYCGIQFAKHGGCLVPKQEESEPWRKKLYKGHIHVLIYVIYVFCVRMPLQMKLERRTKFNKLALKCAHTWAHIACVYLPHTQTICCAVIHFRNRNRSWAHFALRFPCILCGIRDQDIIVQVKVGSAMAKKNIRTSDCEYGPCSSALEFATTRSQAKGQMEIYISIRASATWF